MYPFGGDTVVFRGALYFYSLTALFFLSYNTYQAVGRFGRRRNMQRTGSDSEARERVLNMAERLFGERGYQVVTLRDIAHEIGIRHTSLYHHFPRGKEELFVEVTTRRMHAYRAGLEDAIGAAGSDW